MIDITVKLQGIVKTETIAVVRSHQVPSAGETIRLEGRLGSLTVADVEWIAQPRSDLDPFDNDRIVFESILQPTIYVE